MEEFVGQPAPESESYRNLAQFFAPYPGSRGIIRDMASDMLRGHLDGLLLGALAASPGHGYALSRRIAERSDGLLDVPEGSLYPALHRLESAGWVDSSWETEAGRRRRVYRLTRRGRGAVAGARHEWAAFSAAVTRVLGAA